MSKIKKILSLFLLGSFIFVVAIFILRPAYHGGLFVSDDNVQVTRVQAVYAEIMGGQFPVRYVDQFGNGGGYFLFNFYSPLVYYVGAVLMLLGFSSIAAVKLTFLGFGLVGSVGVFVLLKSRTNLITAWLATIVFLFSPYVFHDFFHRGALPEAAAMMLVPWVLWSFLLIKDGRWLKWSFVCAVLSYSLLVQAHVLTGALVGLLLIFFSWPVAKTKHLLLYWLAVLLALTLAGYYFLPAFFEKQFIQYDQTELVSQSYQDKFVTMADQLSMRPVKTRVPFLGISLTLSLAAMIAFLVVKRKQINKHSNLLIIVLFATATLYLMSPWSAWIWSASGALRNLQFPYRFLTVTTVVLVLGFGLLLEKLKIGLKIIFACFVIGLPLILYNQYYQPSGYQYSSVYQAEPPCRTTAWSDEHLPIWVEECLPVEKDREAAYSMDDKLIVTNLAVGRHGRQIQFTAEGEPSTIEVAKYYFPGWAARSAGGQQLRLSPAEHSGLINIDVPESAIGQLITVELKQTAIQKIGNIMTLLSIAVLAAITFFWSYFETVIGKVAKNIDQKLHRKYK